MRREAANPDSRAHHDSCEITGTTNIARTIPSVSQKVPVPSVFSPRRRAAGSTHPDGRERLAPRYAIAGSTRSVGSRRPGRSYRGVCGGLHTHDVLDCVFRRLVRRPGILSHLRSLRQRSSRWTRLCPVRLFPHPYEPSAVDIAPPATVHGEVCAQDNDRSVTLVICHTDPIERIFLFNSCCLNADYRENVGL